MRKKIQKISIKGIIFHDGKILILKDQNGNWEFPGGRMGFGEHVKETLKREFLEEIDVSKITIGDIVDVWDFISNANNYEYHFVIVVFECRVESNKINISHEHTEYKWIGLDEINNYPMRDGYIGSIEKFRKLRNL